MNKQKDRILIEDRKTIYKKNCFGITTWTYITKYHTIKLNKKGEAIKGDLVKVKDEEGNIIENYE